MNTIQGVASGRYIPSPVNRTQVNQQTVVRRNRDVYVPSSAPLDTADEVQTKPLASAEQDLPTTQYSDKVMQLYESLKYDETFAKNDHRYCWDTPVAEQLAKELLLSDESTLNTLAKEIWTHRAEQNEFLIGYNKTHPKNPQKLQYLPPDYTGIVAEIKSKLHGSPQDKREMYVELDAFLARKAEKVPLADVERLLSGSAASLEKSVFQNFDERMDSVKNELENGFHEAGYSLDVDKAYQFALDTTTFTFSVTGGTDAENELMESIINTHPRENYKFDPLHTTLMALYGGRGNDLSYHPWRVDGLPSLFKDELLEKYGVATSVPDAYTDKMKQFIAAYRRCEMDKNMKQDYGFGVDDISYENGRIIGKTDEITKAIEDMGIDFMKKAGFAYIKLMGEYTGTPEFERAVFVFENGEFKLTYEQVE